MQKGQFSSRGRRLTCPEVLSPQGVDEGGLAHVGNANHQDAVVQVLQGQGRPSAPSCPGRGLLAQEGGQAETYHLMGHPALLAEETQEKGQASR